MREQAVPVVRVVRVVQTARAGAVRAAPGNHVDVAAGWPGERQSPDRGGALRLAGGSSVQTEARPSARGAPAVPAPPPPVMPLTFASSVFAPAASMPGWLQTFVRINPVTDVTDAVRGLLAGGPVGRPLLESAAWITGITAVSWTLTLQRYRARG